MLQKHIQNKVFTLEQLKENTLNLLKQEIDVFPASQLKRVDIFTKDGETKTVETFIFPMETASGKKIGSICRDITKIKQTEENLIQAKKFAEKANEAKSLFIAKISHEIRTPLNGIIGFTNILFENESDKEKKEMLSLINTSSETLLRLISDILDFSKIESGKINLQETEFNLNDVVLSTVKSFQNLASKKQLKLNYNLCENSKNFVIGDKIAIKQILINLLSNALKFTSLGKIDVDLKCEINYEISTAIISVSDTGKGMTNEDLKNISNEILSVTFSDSDKSSGLGLSIVKSLLKLMNGTIEVESEIGVGSKFTVKIPFKLSHFEHQKLDIIQEVKIEKLDTIKILVAEDDLTNQHLIKAFSKNKPWDLVIVDNGEKAVKEFETNNYNIILMDIQMPIMNGIDATKLIRKFENKNKKNHIPIIALTAYAMESDKQKCFDAGMDAFLAKPININKLFATINKYAN
jgi:signal transduction histidine kinase/CheY-like chemotaxis protein